MRARLFFLMILVFCSFFVLAENNSKFDFGFENISSEFGAVRGTIEHGTENVLSREIIFPDWISKITDHLIGAVTIERLILLIGIFFVLFILINRSLIFLPMLDKKMSILASLVVTTLIFVGGIFEWLVDYYYNVVLALSWMNKLGPFKLILAVAILLLVAWGLMKLGEYLEKNQKLTGAEVTGENIRFVSEMGESTRKLMKE